MAYFESAQVEAHRLWKNAPVPAVSAATTRKRCFQTGRARHAARCPFASVAVYSFWCERVAAICHCCLLMPLAYSSVAESSTRLRANRATGN